MNARFSPSQVAVDHLDRFYIDGQWVVPSTDATVRVIDPATEELFLEAAEAQPADMLRAIDAARRAFDDGPWPRLRPEERADYLTAMAEGLRSRADHAAQILPRESGVLHSIASMIAHAPNSYDLYAGLAGTFEFEELVTPMMGGDHGLIVREPVGVVAAIVPWNAPLSQIPAKVAPALLAGCTVVVKQSPEAPAEGYLIAEVAAEVELPPGVINVVTADREVSEMLVRDERVDKISFTGSTAAGRRIASLAGGRIARVSLELGGKSAAVILDDFDLAEAARVLAQAELFMTGQVCTSLTRIVVSRERHDEFVEVLASIFDGVQVGDPFDSAVHMGPLAMERQRDRVEHYVAKGVAEGATLVAGGRRPPHLDRGWFLEPTVFANVDNSSTIAQEEIFGPVLSVIPARDEEDAVRIANDTVFGLNASVFTNDAGRALDVARRIRSGTVGHNAFRGDNMVLFGGYKQSGIGREGWVEGLRPYVESKLIVLDAPVPTEAK